MTLDGSKLLFLPNQYYEEMNNARFTFFLLEGDL